MAEEWTIPATGEHCSACRAPLVPRQPATALLQLLPEGPFRQDLCVLCAPAKVEEDPSAYFWRRLLPAAGGRAPLVVDYALLREVFERMRTRPEEVYRRLSYLVALVLVRKRHLRLLGFQARDGREVMLVRRQAGDPEIAVPAPHLSADQLVETRQALARLLAGDLAEGFSSALAQALHTQSGDDLAADESATPETTAD